MSTCVYSCICSNFLFEDRYGTLHMVRGNTYVHMYGLPTQEDNDDDDVVGDDGDVCALCCTKSDPEKMSMCDKCELQYCTDCIDTHTCDNVILFDSATVSCCAHRLRILNVYLVDNGPERQLCVLEGGDQCAVHGFSSRA